MLPFTLQQMCGRGAIDASGSPPPGPPPVVTGVTLDNTAPTVGDTITATAIGTDCDTFTYQWKADGAAISGETASTYTAARADAMGKALTCEAEGHNSGGAGSPLASDATALVTGAPVNTVAPVATTDGVNAPGGPAIAGTDTLSTTDGTWTGYPVPVISYSWVGGTGPSTVNTYGTSGGDAGDSIACRVTGTNSVSAVFADSNAINISA